MDRLDTIRAFVRVVESGSFSAAAREAGLGQSAISKQVAALEAHLGAQLIRRTSRSLSLTETGQEFFESAVRLIEDFESAESRVGRGQSAPFGLIRVSVAPVFGRIYIVPRLAAFFARYPDIAVELTVSDRAVNLVEEGFDLAIHNGALADSGLIVRRIGSTPIVTVAAPDYLAAHGEPNRPDDLEGRSCVIYAPQGALRPWGFRGPSGDITIQPKGGFRTNDAEQIRAAVLAGLGLAHAPRWLFADEVACGAVRRVLLEYEPAPLAICAVHPAGRRLPTKVRVFIDFLEQIFVEDPRLAALVACE